LTCSVLLLLLCSTSFSFPILCLTNLSFSVNIIFPYQSTALSFYFLLLLLCSTLLFSFLTTFLVSLPPHHIFLLPKCTVRKICPFTFLHFALLLFSLLFYHSPIILNGAL
jgi:hypothetical protein